MAGVTVADTWMSPSSNTHINFTNVSPPPNISLSNEGNGMPVDQLSSRFNPSMAIIVAMVLSTFLLMGFFSVYTRRCILPGREHLLEEVPHRIPSEFVQNQSIQGLDKATIASFPVTSFSLVKGLEKGKAAMECPVCLTDFEGHERIRLLPKCGHAFHLDCIDMWLFSHTNCPLCRQSLIQGPEEFPSMQTFSEATVALESRLEESWRSTQSLAEERYEVRLTLDDAPTQNEVDFNGQDEARSLSRVAEKEATLSLSKKSQSLRIVAQDLEKSEELSSRSVRNLSSSSARYYSKSAKTEDGSPSNSAGLTRSTSPTVIQRLRRKVLKSSQEPEEDKEQLVDSLAQDRSFSFDQKLQTVPVSCSLSFQEAVNKNEDSKL